MTGEPSAAQKTIWLVNLFFGVGPAPSGAVLDSVACGLAQNGFRVEVITGRNVRYNASVVPPRVRFAGRVHRLYCWPVRLHGFWRRLLAWTMFYAGTVRFVLTRRLPEKILVMTTPPFLHIIFVLRNLLSRRQAGLILWNQDTYPDILAAVGLVPRSSLRYKLMSALQRWSLPRVDKVIVPDHAIKETLRQHGARHVAVVPNWEIEASIDELLEDDELHERLRQLKTEYRHLVVYTGNYGWGHNLDVLFEYLRQNPEQRGCFFLFVGGGPRWQSLLDFQRNHRIECMDAISYLPRSKWRALLRDADFGLVALERSCAGLMAPSKIYSYLACGKPLIYVGPDGGNVAEAIKGYQCGFRIDEDDLDGLRRCLDLLCAEGFDYQTLSRNAARAAACRYTESVAIPDMLRIIQQPAGVPGSAG